MTTEQRGLLMALIDEYAAAQPQALARGRLEKVRSAGLEPVTLRVDGRRGARASATTTACRARRS
jgi:hypothetical protein